MADPGGGEAQMPLPNPHDIGKKYVSQRERNFSQFVERKIVFLINYAGEGNNEQNFESFLKSVKPFDDV